MSFFKKIDVENSELKPIISEISLNKTTPIVHSIFNKLENIEKSSKESSFLFIERPEKEEIEEFSILDQKSTSIFENFLEKDEVQSNFDLSNCASLLATLFNDPSLVAIHKKKTLSISQACTIFLSYLKEGKEAESIKQMNETSLSLEQLRKPYSNAKTNLERAKILNKEAEKIALQVKNLKVDSSFLLEGRWLDKQPKASSSSAKLKHVSFQFVKKENGYDLIVYNNNPEAVKIQTRLGEEGKKWVRPLMHFKNIPKEELFFDDDGIIRPDFFQALIEPNITNSPCTSQWYLEQVLGHLHRYRTTPDQEPVGFMTVQAKQATAWHTLKAFLFCNQEKSVYKKLMWQIRLDALQTCYSHLRSLLKEDSASAEQARRLLRNCAQNLLITTAQRHSMEFLDSKESSTARNTAQDLLNRLDVLEDSIIQNREKEIKWDLSGIKESVHAEKLKEEISNSIPEEPKLQPIKTMTPPPLIKPFTLPKPEELVTFFKELSDSKKWSWDHPACNALQIETIVETFPIEGYWDTIPRNDLREILEGMDFLAEKYNVAACLSSAFTTPIHSLTARTLYVVIHQLALRYEQENSWYATNLKDYPIFYNGAYEDKDVFSYFSDPQLIKRDLDLRNYFQKILKQKYNEKNYNPPLFDFNSCTSTSDPKSYADSGDLQYYYKLREKFYVTQLYGSQLKPEDSQELSEQALKRLIEADLAIDLGEERKDEVWVKQGKYARYQVSRGTIKGPLYNKGLSHIISLKKAALLDFLFSDKRQRTFDPKATLRIEPSWDQKWKNGYGPGGGQYEIEGASLRYYQRCDKEAGSQKFTSILPSISFGKSVQKEIHSRFINLQKENSLLLENESKGKDQPVKARNLEILLNDVDPLLKSHQVLYYFKQHRDFLSQPKYQALFEVLFFRTSVQKNKSFYSYYYDEKLSNLNKNYILQYSEIKATIMDSLQEESLCNLCEEFIQEGLQLYVDFQPERRPDVFSALFFIRFAKDLNSFNPKRFEMMAQLITLCQEWLKRTDLKDTERSAIHLHLLYIYQNIPKEQLKSSDIAKLYRSWFFYQNHPVPDKWHFPLLEHTIHRSITQGLSLLDTLTTEEKEQLCSQIMMDQQLIQPTDKFQLKASTATLLEVNLANNEKWQLDMCAGSLINSQGVLKKLSVKPSWLDQHEQDFKALFGAERHSYYQAGDTLYFLSPKYGSIQVKGISDLAPGSKKTEITFDSRLIRQLGGKSFKQIPIENLNIDDFPRALLHNKTAWISFLKWENKDCSSIEGHVIYLTSSKGANTHLITEKGCIHPTDPKTELPLLDRILNSYNHQTKGYSLSAIENPQLIVTEHGINHELEAIHLMRYGITFEISNKDGIKNAVWKERPEYYLDEQQPKGVLGSSSNYLVVKHKNGKKKKLLIPCKPVSAPKLLSSKTKLDLDDIPELSESLERTHPVLELDLESNLPVSTNAEGNLYLALLYMAQNSYQKAFNYLSKVNGSGDLNDLSLQILQWLIQFQSTANVPDPCLAALSLKAASIYQEFYNYKKRYVPIEELDDKLINPLLELYHAKIDHVSHSLELSYEEEMLLLGTDSVFEKRRSYLKKEKFDVVPIHHQSNYCDLFERLPETISLRGLPHPKSGFYHSSFTSGTLEQKKQVEDNIQYVLEVTSFIPTPLKGKQKEEEEEEEKHGYDSPQLLMQSLDSTVPLDQFWPKAYEIACSKGSNAKRRQLGFRLEVMTANEKEKMLAYTLLSSAYNRSTSDISYTTSELLQFTPEKRWDFINEWKYRIEQLHKNAKMFHKPLQFDERCGSNEPVNILPFKKAPKAHCVQEADLKLTFSSAMSGGKEFFEYLSETYFKKSPSDRKVERISNNPKEILKGEDPALIESLEREFADFEKDLEQGIKRNHQDLFQLKNLSDIENLSNRFKIKKNESDNLCLFMEKKILQLANIKPKNQDLRERKLLREQSLTEPALSMKELIALFLKRNKEGFIQANSHLNNPELAKELSQMLGTDTLPIDLLYAMIGQYLEISIHSQHLSDLLHLTNQIESLKDSAERDEKIQELGEELEYNRPYTPEEYPAILVFEYYSGKRLRKRQAELLIYLLQNPDAGANLKMGGGKTSVLAALLLFLSAKPGRLSLFTTPASQFQAVKNNLTRSQAELFNQTVTPIDYKPEELEENLKVLIEIKVKLEKAIEHGEAVIIKPQLLEFIWASFKKKCAESCEGKIISKTTLDHIEALKKIILILRKSTSGLIDELDSTLSILQEVNIPAGIPQKIDAGRIDLVREIFEFLCIPFKDPTDEKEEKEISFQELVGLEKNRQTLLNPSDLKDKIAPLIALRLAKDHKALRLSTTKHHAAFARYVAGTMDAKLQPLLDDPKLDRSGLSEEEMKDLSFLEFLWQMAGSTREEEIEAFHKIVLCRHLFTSLLPATFEREGGRHYGRSQLSGQSSKIVPCVGGIPTTNEFGNHYEALVLAFQNGVQFKLTVEQIKEIAQKLSKAATAYAAQEKQPFDQAPEAILFKELTGQSLGNIENEECLKNALEFANADLRRILAIESQLASDHISFYPHCYTANGLSLVELLDSARGFSGTLPNYLTFHERLAKSILLDVGIEGQIFDKVMERGQKNQHQVHVVEKNTPKAILESVLKNHKKPDQVRLFLDSGGLFKNFKNNDLPYEIWDFFHPNEGKSPVTWNVESIFHYYQQPNSTDPTPAVLKMVGNQLQVVLLGGTTKQDFQENGIDLDTCFFLINEKGCIGTDLPLPKDVIGAMTVNDTMMRCTAFQTILRERLFWKNQDVEFVIPQYIIPKISKTSNLVQDSFNQAIINQGIEVSKQIYKSVPLKIDLILESNILEEFILSKPTSELQVQKLKEFTALLKITRSDDIGNQFGRLESDADTVKVLKAYAASKIDLLKKANPPKELLDKITKEIDILLNNLSDRLPKAVKKAPNTVGLQTQILQQTHQQTQQQTEMQLEQEVELELQRYKDIKPKELKNESTWDSSTIQKFLNKVQSGDLASYQADKENPGCAIVPFADIFNKEKRKFNFRYNEAYQECFESELFSMYSTENFIQATVEQLPFFHPLQRPCHQILIVKGARGYAFFYLSKQEAGAFKKELDKENKHPQVWLIQPDGSSLLAKDKVKLDPKHPAIAQGFLVANILAKNMAYVNKHSKEALKWLRGLGTSKDHNQMFKIRSRFLKLIMSQDTVQKELLIKSPIFVTQNQSSLYKPLRKQNDELSKLTPQDIANLTDEKIIEQLDAEQVNHLLPKQVSSLKPHQIPWLTNKELVKALSKEQFAHLDEFQMAYIDKTQLEWIDPSETLRIQALPFEFIADLSQDRLKKISLRQVSQVKDHKIISCLTDNQLEGLTPEVIAGLEDASIIQRLPTCQIPHITPKQIRNHKPSIDQIKQMTAKEQVQAVYPEYLHFVPKALREQYLSEDQRKNLRNAKDSVIHELTPDQFPYLYDAETVHKLTYEQIKKWPRSDWHYRGSTLGYLNDEQNDWLHRSLTPEETKKKHKEYAKLKREREQQEKLRKDETKRKEELKQQEEQRNQELERRQKIFKQQQEIERQNKLKTISEIDEKLKGIEEQKKEEEKTEKELLEKLKVIKDKQDNYDKEQIKYQKQKQEIEQYLQSYSLTQSETITEISTGQPNHPTNIENAPANTENVAAPTEPEGYVSSTLARKANQWLNKTSTYYVIKDKQGWAKLAYIGNIFNVVSKPLHLIAMAVNIATVVLEVFIAIALSPIAIFAKPIAFLILLSPKMRGGKIEDFYKSWNWSMIGHFGNALAYLAAAVTDLASVMITPSLGFDLNNKIKQGLRIIER